MTHNNLDIVSNTIDRKTTIFYPPIGSLFQFLQHSDVFRVINDDCEVIAVKFSNYGTKV